MSYSCLTPGGTEAETGATAEVAVCPQTPGNFSRWDEQWWVMALRACLPSGLIMFNHVWASFSASKSHFSGNLHWCQIRICRCSSNFRGPVSRGFRAGNQEDLIQKLFMGWAYVNMMINQYQQLDFWMPDFCSCIHFQGWQPPCCYRSCCTARSEFKFAISDCWFKSPAVTLCRCTWYTIT